MRCGQRFRHWFAVLGAIGIRTPVCVYCGSPNPRKLSEDDWTQLIDWARDHSVGDYVRSAIEEREAAGITDGRNRSTDGGN